MGPYIRFAVILLQLLVLALIVEAIKRLPEWITDERARRVGVADTDRMSGDQFEKWLEYQFRRAGYSVRRTPYQGDHGADLILTGPQGVKIAVQAKQLSHKCGRVGAKALGEVMRGQKYYGCHQAWLITNRSFTDQAKFEARRLGITLIDRQGLIDFVNRVDQAEREKICAGQRSTPGTQATTKGKKA